MPYNEKTAERISKALAGIRGVDEKKMFGGIAFMINDKMCIGVDKNDIIIRCDSEMHEELLTKKGARPFDLTGRPMKGWLLVGPEGINSEKDFEWWIKTAIESNKKTPKAKKKK